MSCGALLFVLFVGTKKPEMRAPFCFPTEAACWKRANAIAVLPRRKGVPFMEFTCRRAA